MIDVSGYQGVVNWENVRSSGVTHAYIKFGEEQRVDARARENILNARNADMQIGLYYYAHPSRSALDEARWFLRTVGAGFQLGDLPPALDLEVTEGLSYVHLNDWKAQWLAAVDAHVECLSVFYSYYYFWKQMTLYPERPVWGAALGSHFAAPKTWAIRQYSFTSTCPGIVGNVDASKMLWEPKRIGSGL